MRLDASRIVRGLRRRTRVLLSSYRQGPRPNIVVFAMRRGGSTLLADMLSSDQGVLMINEPFLVLPDVPHLSFRRRWLDLRRHGVYFDLSDAELDRVRAYTEELLAGRAPFGVCRYPKFPLRADRVLLKDLNIPTLVDWMVDSFDIQAVRLLRHPAPQALSILRLGWGFIAEAYYDRPAYLATVLNDDQIECGARILSEGSAWQKAILDWSLLYRLLVHTSKAPTPLVTHEELTLDPVGTSRFLGGYLHLQDLDRVSRCVRVPSSSSRRCSAENLELILSGDSRTLIQSWLRKIDATQLEQAQAILDRFEVEIYNMSSPLPDLDRAGLIGGRRVASLTIDRPEPHAAPAQASAAG